MATIAVHGSELVRLQSNGTLQTPILRGMYDNKVTFDVKLMGKAAGIQPNASSPILAHKAVLAQASKYFCNLFFVDKPKKAEFSMPNVGHDNLRSIVEYIYTDKVDMKRDEAVDRIRGILSGANFLKMDDLVEACELFLTHNSPVTINNCIDVWSLARRHDNLERLQEACVFISQNLGLLIKDAKFLSMAQEECGKLLLSEPVVVGATADDRCRAAIAWLKYDRIARAACVEDMLNLVPLDKDAALSIDTLIEAGDIHMAMPKAAVRLMAAYVGTVKRFKWDRELAFPKVEEEVCNNTPLPAAAAVAVAVPVWKEADAWYLVGGSKLTQLMVYDVARRFWSISALPWKRTAAGACAMGKRIMVMGGIKSGAVTADIDEYDVQTGTWCTSASKLCRARKSLAVCADQQYAYALGGFDAQNLAEKYQTGVVQSVRPIAVLNAGRYNAASTFFSKGAGDTLYVAGGCGGPAAARLGSIDKYDCASDKWSHLGELKLARSLLGTAFLGDDLYLAGGFNGTEGVADVEVFNVRTGQIRAERKLLYERAGCGAVSLDNNVVCVIGGKATKDVTNTVEAFDCREGKWTAGIIVPHMPAPNSFFALASA